MNVPFGPQVGLVSLMAEALCPTRRGSRDAAAPFAQRGLRNCVTSPRVRALMPRIARAGRVRAVLFAGRVRQRAAEESEGVATGGSRFGIPSPGTRVVSAAIGPSASCAVGSVPRVAESQPVGVKLGPVAAVGGGLVDEAEGDAVMLFTEGSDRYVTETQILKFPE